MQRARPGVTAGWVHVLLSCCSTASLTHSGPPLSLERAWDWPGQGPPTFSPRAALQLHQGESSDSQPFTPTRTTQDDRPGLVRAELLLDSKRQNRKQKSPPTAGTPTLSGCYETWSEELSAVVSAQQVEVTTNGLMKRGAFVAGTSTQESKGVNS